MAAPVIPGVFQFSDADGAPLAMGTLDTYAAGSSARKLTWKDINGDAANTNPIVLDASGSAVIWGDGIYRLVLRDSVGNLIWDQTATTIVSAAMASVVSAPTIAEAARLLGINDAIAAEAAARVAGDAALSASLTTTQTNLVTVSNNLAATTTNLANETTRATAAEANLQSQITAISTAPGHPSAVVLMQTGTSTSSSTGAINVTFPAAFVTRTIAIQVYGGVTYPNAYYQQTVSGGVTGALTLTAATGNLMNDTAGVPNFLTNQPFTYYVTGT